MDTSTYKKSVFKTLSIKPAKQGLRYVARNTARTNLMHLMVGFATETGELLQTMQGFILGAEKVTPEIKNSAFEEMGDIGYYLVGGAKAAKVKVPGASKRVKVVGTIGKIVLDLNSVATDCLDLTKKNFYGPKMEGKLISASQKEVDQERLETLRALLTKGLNLYWMLCWAMFQDAPAKVFAGNIAKLQARYPEGFFDLKSQEERDKEKELKAMNEAAAKVPAKAKPKAKAPSKAATA